MQPCRIAELLAVTEEGVIACWRRVWGDDIGVFVTGVDGIRGLRVGGGMQPCVASQSSWPLQRVVIACAGVGCVGDDIGVFV